MDFTKMNETDVREEIIAPLIRNLGYRTGEENNVLREVSLKYSFTFIGRKNKGKDITLRGFADYILEAGRSVRWVIEAKPPAEITQDDIEQAFTYANHAEVRAVYFVLCNGHTLLVFQTNRGPDEAPIHNSTYEEFSSPAGLIILQNLLAPRAILRDHPKVVLDISPPIGPGLRSFGKISGGHIHYDDIKPTLPALAQMQISVVAGSVQRNENGAMIAYVETRAPVRVIDEFIRENNLAVFEMMSYSTSLSVDPLNPTVFSCKMSTIFPAGGKLIDVQTWNPVTIPVDWQMEVDFQASVFLAQEILYGKVQFVSRANGHFLVEASGTAKLNIS